MRVSLFQILTFVGLTASQEEKAELRVLKLCAKDEKFTGQHRLRKRTINKINPFIPSLRVKP
jgi:hypothetical protein